MAAGGRLIPRGSEECEKLWKESAKAFLERLGTVAPGIRVVVLENYLTERVGDLETTEPFPELEEIRRTNAVLAGYYAYLRKICPDAVWISTADEPLYFTDKNYEYGAVPSHLNEIANRRIAKRIQAPPILAVSRRAYGFDHREAQNGPYYTRKYRELKAKLLQEA